MVETHWEFWVDSEKSVVLSSHMDHSSKTYWRFHLKGTFCPSTWTHFPCYNSSRHPSPSYLPLFQSCVSPRCFGFEHYYCFTSASRFPPPPPQVFVPCLLPMRLVATGRKSDGVELVSLTEGMDEVEVPRIKWWKNHWKVWWRFGSWDGKGKEKLWISVVNVCKWVNCGKCRWILFIMCHEYEELFSGFLFLFGAQLGVTESSESLGI